jgi:beta-galactosidase
MPTPITDGEVDGDSIRFNVGNAAYSGRLIVDVIELRQEANGGLRAQRPPAKPAEARPVVGPAPDGSDPSHNPFSGLAVSAPIVIHRVKR